MELRNNGKLNFIIDLFINYKDQMSGGLVALHKLAYEIANYGHNVYIFCEPEYPHENITVIPCNTEIVGSRFHSNWEFFTYNLNNTISIYTEHNLYNPFGTKHIARWLLYHTKKEYEQNYFDHEYYFNFGGCKSYRNRDEGLLTTLDYNLEKLYIQEPIVNRSGYCHILHKNSPPNAEKIVQDFNSVSLENWFEKGGYDFLREQFNKYEFFLTFDQNTYLTVAAALCGCKSIILNPEYRERNVSNANTESEYYYEPITPLEYRLQNPRYMFGVAYGIEDLNWSEKTLDLVRNYIINLEKVEKKTVERFIKFWIKKCND